MKKLLLIASFFVCGSSIICSEGEDGDNNQPVNQEDKSPVLRRTSKEIILKFVHENPVHATVTALGVGTFFALPFISLKTKAVLGLGIVSGAAVTLRAFDENTYNDLKDEAIDTYKTVIVPKCHEIKNTMTEWYNQNFKVQKKD